MSRSRNRARSFPWRLGRRLCGVEQLECRSVLNADALMAMCDVAPPDNHASAPPQVSAPTTQIAQAASQADCDTVYAPAPEAPSKTIVSMVEHGGMSDFGGGGIVIYFVMPTRGFDYEAPIVSQSPPPDVHLPKPVDLQLGQRPHGPAGDGASPLADPMAIAAAAAQTGQEKAASAMATSAITNSTNLQPPAERAVPHIVASSVVATGWLAERPTASDAPPPNIPTAEATVAARALPVPSVVRSANNVIASAASNLKSEVIDSIGALPAAISHLAQGKAPLADIRVDLPSLERALDNVMRQVERLGAGITDWLDENQLSVVAAAVAAATAGGATAWYWRRSARPAVVARDDETSSNWLFVRMQTTPGDS
jgi:hypothetical protein